MLIKKRTYNLNLLMNRILFTRSEWIPTICKTLEIGNKRSYCVIPEDVVIPKRIPRGPTDILKALSSTVGADYTAAHYKYHDDPFLIPLSALTKKQYALAKESGRKAARWIRDTHRDLFQHRDAEPFIEAFAPQLSYDENSEASEETLMNLVQDRDISNATVVYRKLQKCETGITDEVKKKFLQLLCYYNCKEVLDEEWIEERTLQETDSRHSRDMNMWKDGNLADEVYDSISKKDPEAVCSMLRGLAKHNHFRRAWTLFESTDPKFLDLETYNWMIHLVLLQMKKSSEQWKLIRDLLWRIKNANLYPDINTLNAVMKVLAFGASDAGDFSRSLQVLSEFHVIGVKPSLATYYYLLRASLKDAQDRGKILYDIMDEIEDQEFSVVHPEDTRFFSAAMSVCHLQLQTSALQRKLQSDGTQLQKRDILFEPIDRLFQHYFKLVPHIYTPEVAVMEMIIGTVSAQGASVYLGSLWSDLISFNHTNKRTIVQSMLDAIANNLTTDAKIMESYKAVVCDMVSRMEQAKTDTYKGPWVTAPLLSQLVCVSLSLNLGNLGWKVFELSKRKLLPPLSSTAVLQLAEQLIINQEPLNALVSYTNS